MLEVAMFIYVSTCEILGRKTEREVHLKLRSRMRNLQRKVYLKAAIPHVKRAT